jgi:hypothetical protein
MTLFSDKSFKSLYSYSTSIAAEVGTMQDAMPNKEYKRPRLLTSGSPLLRHN